MSIVFEGKKMEEGEKKASEMRLRGRHTTKKTEWTFREKTGKKVCKSWDYKTGTNTMNFMGLKMKKRIGRVRGKWSFWKTFLYYSGLTSFLTSIFYRSWIESMENGYREIEEKLPKISLEQIFGIYYVRVLYNDPEELAGITSTYQKPLWSDNRDVRVNLMFSFARPIFEADNPSKYNNSSSIWTAILVGQQKWIFFCEEPRFN